MPVTHAAIDDAVSRSVAIAALVGVALIHLLQAPDAFSDAFYLGMLFIGAAVAAVLVAVALSRTSDRRVWTAALALPALILIGYLFSRITGLPGVTDDVGEWDEPLGLASMVAEGLLVCVSAVALAVGREPMAVIAVIPGFASVVQRRRAAEIGLLDGEADPAPRRSGRPIPGSR